jgi:LysR family hydrogen peroxide-inducible transcriptional activator
MEFHQLRDFVAVAATGNFSQAAHRCRVAQPSLSKAVQRLEAEMGTKLFVRSKRGTVLTSAGEILYRHALNILNEVEQAKQEMAERNGLGRGTVRIGVLPTISPYFLPRVLAQFAQSYPALEVVVVEDRAVVLMHRIDVSELDVALVSLPIPDNGFMQETLFTEELLLTVPSEHPLAIKEKIGLKDLEAERFILIKEVHGPGDQISKFCQQSDLHLQIVLENSQIETVQSLIMAGLGISLVPEMARISGRIPLVYRSLENPKPTRSVSVVWRKGHEQSRATKEFVNHLRQISKAFLETLKK